MRIIKPGRINKRTKLFTCDNCGCVFEADENEYKYCDYSTAMYYNSDAKCKCPSCGNDAYAEYRRREKASE